MERLLYQRGPAGTNFGRTSFEGTSGFALKMRAFTLEPRVTRNLFEARFRDLSCSMWRGRFRAGTHPLKQKSRPEGRLCKKEG